MPPKYLPHVRHSKCLLICVWHYKESKIHRMYTHCIQRMKYKQINKQTNKQIHQKKKKQ